MQSMSSRFVRVFALSYLRLPSITRPCCLYTPSLCRPTQSRAFTSHELGDMDDRVPRFMFAMAGDWPRRLRDAGVPEVRLSIEYLLLKATAKQSRLQLHGHAITSEQTQVFNELCEKRLQRYQTNINTRHQHPAAAHS